MRKHGFEKPEGCARAGQAGKLRRLKASNATRASAAILGSKKPPLGRLGHGNLCLSTYKKHSLLKILTFLFELTGNCLDAKLSIYFLIMS